MADEIYIDVTRIKRVAAESVGDHVKDTRPARVGHPIPVEGADNINVPVTVAGRPGYIYIHGEGDSDDGDLQGVTMVLNSGKGKLRREDLTYNRFIRVKPRKSGGWIVDGLDEESDAEFSAEQIVHPQTSTVLAQFDNGLLQPTNPPSMQVGVGLGFYRYNGQVCAPITVLSQDFTAEVPAGAGDAKAFAIEINPIDGTLFYTEGAEFDATLTRQEAFDGGFLPQPSHGALMTGWVKCVNGMTGFRHMVHIYPAHEVIAADRIPMLLEHHLIVGANSQYVVSRVEISAGGDLEPLGRLCFV